MSKAAERALETLRDMIVSGELAAGSDHLESELAERLGLSRTPVREALIALAARGLLEVRPRRGVRILPVSPEDMREIYEVLTELESLAAARAARAQYHEIRLRRLATAIEDMDAALKRKDLEGWAQADDRFHAELVRLGGNRRVEAIVAMMQDQVRRARRATLYLRPLPTQSVADHAGVYEAILFGKPVLAEDRHRTHRQKAGHMLVKLLEDLHLRGL